MVRDGAPPPACQMLAHLRSPPINPLSDATFENAPEQRPPPNPNSPPALPPHLPPSLPHPALALHPHVLYSPFILHSHSRLSTEHSPFSFFPHLPHSPPQVGTLWFNVRNHPIGGFATKVKS